MAETAPNTASPSTDSRPGPSAPLLPSTTYSCTSCQIAFTTGQEQRTHMKEPWHLSNLKRRMAELPPVSRQAYDAQIDRETTTKKTRTTRSCKPILTSPPSDDESSDPDDEEPVSPYQCLFCSLAFSADEAGLALNLEHMRSAHGMFIPDPELVVDMPGFVGYLATEVRDWHECLYCGATKPSTESIQSHMRDKGHCLLNFDREPELLDFWDGSAEVDEHGASMLEQAPPTTLSETEMRFASGKVIESRHAAHAPKRPSKRRTPADPTSNTLPLAPEDAEPLAVPETSQSQSQPQPQPQLSSTRQLARRDEMSIVGITPQQRQALVLAEKKAQRSEAVARRAREWASSRGANSQKFDQIDNQGKWGKQNHKLLPR